MTTVRRLGPPCDVPCTVPGCKRRVISMAGDPTPVPCMEHFEQEEGLA
jgi:hypothetical protein